MNAQSERNRRLVRLMDVARSHREHLREMVNSARADLISSLARYREDKMQSFMVFGRTLELDEFLAALERILTPPDVPERMRTLAFCLPKDALVVLMGDIYRMNDYLAPLLGARPDLPEQLKNIRIVSKVMMK